jgi:hypothetical protein
MSLYVHVHRHVLHSWQHRHKATAGLCLTSKPHSKTQLPCVQKSDRSECKLFAHPQVMEAQTDPDLSGSASKCLRDLNVLLSVCTQLLLIWCVLAQASTVPVSVNAPSSLDPGPMSTRPYIIG